jgi:hypothetical protein
MKSIVLAIVLMASAAQAYLVPGNGDGHQRPHQPAPYYPNPYEPNPYHPSPYDPYYPDHSYSDYGPARTIRWKDMGESRVDKVVGETIRLHVGGRLVNEILLRSTEADTEITRAVAILSSGQRVHLATGLVRENRDVRLRLDSRYSLRVRAIEVDATSRNLIGSRARLRVWLGLAD